MAMVENAKQVCKLKINQFTTDSHGVNISEMKNITA